MIIKRLWSLEARVVDERRCGGHGSSALAVEGDGLLRFLHDIIQAEAEVLEEVWCRSGVTEALEQVGGHALLLSEGAQARLGFAKNMRAGTVA